MRTRGAYRGWGAAVFGLLAVAAAGQAASARSILGKFVQDSSDATIPDGEPGADNAWVFENGLQAEIPEDGRQLRSFSEDFNHGGKCSKEKDECEYSHDCCGYLVCEEEDKGMNKIKLDIHKGYNGPDSDNYRRLEGDGELEVIDVGPDGETRRSLKRNKNKGKDKDKKRVCSVPECNPFADQGCDKRNFQTCVLYRNVPTCMCAFGGDFPYKCNRCIVGKDPYDPLAVDYPRDVDPGCSYEQPVCDMDPYLHRCKECKETANCPPMSASGVDLHKTICLDEHCADPCEYSGCDRCEQHGYPPRAVCTCPSNQVLAPDGKHCVGECVTDSDCPSDTYCYQGNCVDPCQDTACEGFCHIISNGAGFPPMAVCGCQSGQVLVSDGKSCEDRDTCQESDCTVNGRTLITPPPLCMGTTCTEGECCAGTGTCATIACPELKTPKDPSTSCNGVCQESQCCDCLYGQTGATCNSCGATNGGTLGTNGNCGNNSCADEDDADGNCCRPYNVDTGAFDPVNSPFRCGCQGNGNCPVGTTCSGSPEQICGTP